MAERRMFSKIIIDSDLFLDLPQSSQNLYFHLSMRADDDGFIGNPKRIMRMIGASDDDMKLLIAKQFLIPFESGVVVIKHWKIHNYIRNDRYKETVYTKEKEQLQELDNKEYSLNMAGIPTVDRLDTQDRIGKDSIDKDSIYIAEKSEEKDNIKVIIDYLNEKANTNYRSTTKKTIDCIKARLNEGFNLEDFMTVIDHKCSDWLGTSYEQYLRPETLFGNKFEGYLNQKTSFKNNNYNNKQVISKPDFSDGNNEDLGEETYNNLEQWLSTH